MTTELHSKTGYAIAYSQGLAGKWYEIALRSLQGQINNFKEKIEYYVN